MIISPNPSTGRFMLRVSATVGEKATVTISDICGKSIIQQECDASGLRPEPFDLTGYPKGLYLVKIQTGKGSLVRKLVIE